MHFCKCLVFFSFVILIKTVLCIEKETVEAIYELARTLNYQDDEVNKNVVISPLGATLALAQISQISCCRFNRLLGDFIKSDIQGKLVHTDLRKIENNLNQNENVADTFNAYTKTALFHDDNIEINTTLLKKYYSLDLLKPLPFSTDLDTSQIFVNKWIQEKSHNLLDEFNVPSDSRAMLLNIVFFNGSWVEPFVSEYTVDMPFYLNENKQTKATFMSGEQDIDYIEDRTDGLKMIKLKYKNNKDINSSFSMYVLLPNNYNVKEIISKLTFKKFENLISNMKEDTVDIRIPKLDIHTYFDIKKHLEHKALNRNETVQYRLKSNNKKDRLILTNIFQEVRLQVFETGTTAVALTGGLVDLGAFSKDFTVDRPYIMIIRDDISGVLLFWATIYKPT